METPATPNVELHHTPKFTVPPRPATVPDVNNLAVAFAYKTDQELERALLLFRSIQYPVLVKVGPPMVRMGLSLGLPIRGLLRKYFFNQFCGGFSLQDALPRCEMLARYGVRATLDYAVEAVQNESGFRATHAAITEVINLAAQRPEVGFVALKITGLGAIKTLEAIQKGNAPVYEQNNYEAIRQRLDSLCALAAAKSVSLLIDAEESWIQQPIDALAEEMTLKYNSVKPIVYTTAQMYRHDRLAYIMEYERKMHSAGVIPAVKLVRGAYLEKETQRAKALAYPNPIQPSKAHTDADFNTALEYIIERIDRFAVVVGSHNEESALLAAKRLMLLGITANHPHLHFSQLYGMSDTISFNFAAAGFNVSKYLPYGPLDAVLPYLFRRAEENSSIAGQSGRELKLIEAELTRRRRARTPRA